MLTCELFAILSVQGLSWLWGDRPSMSLGLQSHCKPDSQRALKQVRIKRVRFPPIRFDLISAVGTPARTENTYSSKGTDLETGSATSFVWSKQQCCSLFRSYIPCLPETLGFAIITNFFKFSESQSKALSSRARTLCNSAGLVVWLDGMRHLATRCKQSAGQFLTDCPAHLLTA